MKVCRSRLQRAAHEPGRILHRSWPRHRPGVIITPKPRLSSWLQRPGDGPRSRKVRHSSSRTVSATLRFARCAATIGNLRLGGRAPDSKTSSNRRRTATQVTPCSPLHPLLLLGKAFDDHHHVGETGLLHSAHASIKSPPTPASSYDPVPCMVHVCIAGEKGKRTDE